MQALPSVATPAGGQMPLLGRRCSSMSYTLHYRSTVLAVLPTPPRKQRALSFISSSVPRGLFSEGGGFAVERKWKRTWVVPSTISPTPDLPEDESEKDQLSQVSKRLESSSRYFKKLGGYGFWTQLICSTVAAVILSLSLIITGKITSPTTFYSTTGGIVAAFISAFWSFGYLRLSDELRKNASQPSKAPTRIAVMRSLRNGIVLNLVGMGSAIVGMIAAVGSVLIKSLTSSYNPFRGVPAANRPVLALDIFLLQASTNTILSHFLGLVFSLELMRSITQPQSHGSA